MIRSPSVVVVVAGLSLSPCIVRTSQNRQLEMNCFCWTNKSPLLVIIRIFSPTPSLSHCVLSAPERKYLRKLESDPHRTIVSRVFLARRHTPRTQSRDKDDAMGTANWRVPLQFHKRRDRVLSIARRGNQENAKCGHCLRNSSYTWLH